MKGLIYFILVVIVICIISSCLASFTSVFSKKKTTSDTTKETQSELQPEHESEPESQFESQSEIKPEPVRPVYDEEQYSSQEEIHNVLTIGIKGDVGDELYNIIINGNKYENQRIASQQETISTYKLNEPLNSFVLEYTNDKKVNGKDRNIRLTKLYLNDMNIMSHLTKVGSPDKDDRVKKGILAWNGSYKYQAF